MLKDFHKGNPDQAKASFSILGATRNVAVTVNYVEFDFT